MSNQNSFRELTIILCLILLSSVISGCSTPRELNYVALGDSIPDGWGIGGYGEEHVNYVECFAEHLRKDFDIDIAVQNFCDSSGIRTVHLIEKLQKDDELRQAVADADIITVWIGVNELGTPPNLYMAGMCGGEDNLEFVRERVHEFNNNIDNILDEILALNSSEETQIMIADNVIPAAFAVNWKKQGSFEVLQAELYEALNDHLYQAARERNITVVPVYRAINGPSGDKGNEGLYQDDGIHFNVEGHRLIADIHREAWEWAQTLNQPGT